MLGTMAVGGKGGTHLRVGGGERNARIAHLDHHVHQLEARLELPLRTRDVPRVPLPSPPSHAQASAGEVVVQIHSSWGGGGAAQYLHVLHIAEGGFAVEEAALAVREHAVHLQRRACAVAVTWRGP